MYITTSFLEGLGIHSYFRDISLGQGSNIVWCLILLIPLDKSVLCLPGDYDDSLPFLRIIEVEPSVNISNGQSAGIVQVRHNRIVGRLDSNDSTSRSTSPPSRPSPAHSSSQSGQGSPQHVSPLRESSSGEKRNIDGSGGTY